MTSITGATEKPSSSVYAFFDGSFQQWIPGESAPRFQLRTDALFVTDHRDQIARPAATQHSNQLRQKARRERLSTDIKIEVSLHRNACILQVREDSHLASPPESTTEDTRAHQGKPLLSESLVIVRASVISLNDISN